MLFFLNMAFDVCAPKVSLPSRLKNLETLVKEKSTAIPDAKATIPMMRNGNKAVVML